MIMTNNRAMSRSIYVPATSEWGDWVSGGLTERGSAIISDFALKWLEIHPKLRSQLLIFCIIILQLLCCLSFSHGPVALEKVQNFSKTNTQKTNISLPIFFSRVCRQFP